MPFIIVIVVIYYNLYCVSHTESHRRLKYARADIANVVASEYMCRDRYARCLYVNLLRCVVVFFFHVPLNL